MQSPAKSRLLPSTLSALCFPLLPFVSTTENYLKEESMQLLNSSMACCTHKARLNVANMTLWFTGWFFNSFFFFSRSGYFDFTKI